LQHLVLVLIANMACWRTVTLLNIFKTCPHALQQTINPVLGMFDLVLLL